MKRLWALWTVSLAILLQRDVNASDQLSRALLDDLLPPSSSLCDGQGTSFSLDFKPNPENKWDETAVDLEEALFLAEMKHTDSDSNRTWTMRLGQGSNMYSFIGAYGESVPPQFHAQGEFVDEVWQNVVVAAANTDENKWFIHQAGTYSKGDRNGTTPYFSPNLANFCEGNQCSSASWGQQAHLPTGFRSSAIYSNRYRDCGDGVVELTIAIHNDANGTDDFVYTNTPWGGVRTSTLGDMVIGDAGNSTEGTLLHPLWSWGVDTALPRLEDTGGYTAFAQGLPKEQEDFRMPVNLTITIASVCTESPSHSLTAGKLVLRCGIAQTATVITGSAESLTFTNPDNGDSIALSGVHHWAWQGKTLFCYPNSSVEQFNLAFPVGASVQVTARDTSLPLEDNLALALVHGSHPKEAWDRAHPRLRIGRAGSGKNRRDYTVFTVNTIANINIGDTYVQRQFLITDRYVGLDERARLWSTETMRDKHTIDTAPVGREVKLYLLDDQLTFSAAIGPCTKSATCVGSTTPKPGAVAFFVVECGDVSYTGSDQYHFSPEGTPVQSWKCNGQTGVEPNRKLLGYFPEGSCSSLQLAKYNGVNCPIEETSAPTDSPTSQPVDAPTTSQPVTAPTTAQPTSSPVEFPTTVQPVVALTDSPTIQPVEAPTIPTAPAGEPSPPSPTICFSERATVQVEHQSIRVPMSSLNVGDRVLTSKQVYEPIYAFGHFHATKPAQFLQISTAGSSVALEISAEHMLFVQGKSGPVRADSIKVGTVLVRVSVGQSSPSTAVVTRIATIHRTGVYAPLTPDGTIVVDDILASTYVAGQSHGNQYLEIQNSIATIPLLQADLAHMWLSPLRIMCMGMSPKLCESHDEDGMHEYVKFGLKFVQWGDKQHAVVQVNLLVLILMVMGIFCAIEVLSLSSLYGLLLLAAVAAWKRVAKSKQKTKYEGKTLTKA